jgi:hypothetical protein
MFVLKASDRNPVEKEAGGGKEGKEHSVGILHFVSNEKVIYFVVEQEVVLGRRKARSAARTLGSLHVYHTREP